LLEEPCLGHIRREIDRPMRHPHFLGGLAFHLHVELRRRVLPDEDGREPGDHAGIREPREPRLQLGPNVVTDLLAIDHVAGHAKTPRIAAQMGSAPAAVAKHLLEIEKTALLNVVVSPSEQGKRVYERLELEPRPEQKQTAEALDRNTVTILRFLLRHPDASTTEVVEELGFSEYTTVNSLRVLMAVQLITKQRGPA